MNLNSKYIASSFGIFLFFTVFLFSSCTKKLVETSIKSEITKNKILIASDASEFKDRLLKRFISAYKPDYSIDIINIDTLNSKHVEDYSGVLIMDTCMAWTGFNPSLKFYLENSKNRNKTVLFISAGDPDWKYSYEEIDAVTSASEIENEETVFNELTGRMNILLSTK